MADGMSVHGGLGRRMCRGLSGSAERRSWHTRGWRRARARGLRALRDRLEKELLKADASRVNGGGENPHTTQKMRCMGHPIDSCARRVPSTTNICFDGIDGEALVIALDLKGLAVSTGAACSSGAIEPSHVLLAMGLTPDQARASIRFSLGQQNMAEDVEFRIVVVPETVARLRELSPVWRGAASLEPRVAR